MPSCTAWLTAGARGRKGGWGGCSGKGRRAGGHPPLLSCCASICWSFCVSSRSRRCAWKVRAAMSSPQQRTAAASSCLQSERENMSCRNITIFLYQVCFSVATKQCLMALIKYILVLYSSSDNNQLTMQCDSWHWSHTIQLFMKWVKTI